MLGESDLLAADDHLAECDACRAAAAKLISARSLVSGFQRSLEEGSGEHLPFEQLAAYVDGSLDSVAFEIAEVHLQDCAACREDLEGIREIHDQQNEELPVHPATVREAPTFAEQIRGILGIRILSFGLPVIVLIGLAVFAFWLTQETGPEKLPQIAVVDDPQPAGQPSLEPKVNANQSSPEDDTNTERAAITLVDGSGQLELGPDGKMIGTFAGEYDARIAAAVRTGNLSISNDALRLKGSAGVLMGPQGEASGLRVRSPIGKVITTDRPQFTWSRVEGAESYSVEIFDANFNKIASSPPLTAAQWRSTSALPRGREYIWQVTAIRNGESLRAPSRPAPDAKFMILSASKLSEIERAKRSYGRSNLVLGILYAEAGLLDDAEREFQALLRKNPGSDSVRRLLNKVRAAR